MQEGVLGILQYCGEPVLMAARRAAVKGSKDIVSMLVGFGVDLECQDNEGHACPVAFGSGGWRRLTVEVVVGKGANVKAKSSPAGASTLSV
ncbi:hypothetical protein NC651_019975 [Populus alba x Populus x berolinensis]|nr:hypothetical protein NC651_019970 [Populus alba x Populus x berolinensis]KAJ6902351.1 hypothetical protein NC651_019975 [Populus alba x Populus x berolinensis]